MFKKQKFEEAAPAAAPDQHAALVEALTAMGLSAEQAEAVHTMAMDLIEAAPAEAAPSEEVVEVEASRQRKRMSRGRRSGRARMSHKRKHRYSREDRVRSRRSEMSEERETRSEGPARPSRGQRPTRSRRGLSAERNTIARQRRQISEMRKELEAVNNAPAARKLSNNPLKEKANNALPVAPFNGSPKERAFEMMKNMFTK